MATKECKTFEDATVNWADFGCVITECCTDNEGIETYRVYIEEANPDNHQVREFIQEELAFLGFIDIEVIFEW